MSLPVPTSLSTTASSSQTTFSGDTTLTVPLTVSTTATPSGGGGGDGGGNGGGSGGASSSLNLANSASLYLYTFLATLVLLLSVSGAIVVRSFVLRRRNRLMVEEAIRNGTWVPPTPPTRPPRVDLSKKPPLWEAYLGDGGWQVGVRGLGQGSGKEPGIGTNWKLEYSKDWESIKPLSVDFVESKTSPYSGSTANITGSVSPPVPIPVPSPITPSATRGREESQRTAEVSTTPSLLARARTLLNPTPLHTSPLPASPPSADNANAHLNEENPTNMSMTELRTSSPTTVRVAVLVAMPSLPPSSHRSSVALSASFTSPSISSSNVPQPTTSHPLQISPSQSLHTADDDEHPIPQLEMGIAEVVLVPSENSTDWDNAHRRQAKASYSRGSSYAEP